MVGSLVAQEVQETRVQSLGQENSLEEEMATHSSILAWKVPWTEEPEGATVHGVTKESEHIHTYSTHLGVWFQQTDFREAQTLIP